MTRAVLITAVFAALCATDCVHHPFGGHPEQWVRPEFRRSGNDEPLAIPSPVALLPVQDCTHAGSANNEKARKLFKYAFSNELARYARAQGPVKFAPSPNGAICEELLRTRDEEERRFTTGPGFAEAIKAQMEGKPEPTALVYGYAMLDTCEVQKKLTPDDQEDYKPAQGYPKDCGEKGDVRLVAALVGRDGSWIWSGESFCGPTHARFWDCDADYKKAPTAVWKLFRQFPHRVFGDKPLS